MTAADAHLAGVIELGRKHSGLVRVHAEPIGHAVDRGVPVRRPVSSARALQNAWERLAVITG
jgi:hypothetical protein